MDKSHRFAARDYPKSEKSLPRRYCGYQSDEAIEVVEKSMSGARMLCLWFVGITNIAQSNDAVWGQVLNPPHSIFLGTASAFVREPGQCLFITEFGLSDYLRR